MNTNTQCWGQPASAGPPPLHVPPIRIVASRTHIPPGSLHGFVDLDSGTDQEKKIVLALILLKK